MFNTNRKSITKAEKRNDDSNAVMTLKYVMLSLFTITILLFGPNAKASTDSTGVSNDANRKQITSQLSPEKAFFVLDTGSLGPGRPDAGESYWTPNSRATTGKRCPEGYTPSHALSYVASEQGGGSFYGSVVLSADFNKTNYNLYNIQAYTIKDTRNGYLTFRWVIYCKAN